MAYKFYGWNNADCSPQNNIYPQIKSPLELYDALSEIWRAETCAPRLRNKWTPENKTLGQCSITAFLVQDIFGGKVYGIPRDGGNFHCYNVVGDCCFDLTSEQFGSEKLVYENNPEQFREIHFAKEEKKLRYEMLKKALLSYQKEKYQMNETIKNIINRRSVRNFKPDMIPDDILERIIKAGTYAATGMGMQSPIIIAVTNKELRDRLSVMNAKFMGKDNFDPFYGAPVVLIVLADKSRPTYLYDGSLVMGNLMLAAQSEGIGSCWIHRAKEEFETDECRDILKSLGIDGDYEGIGHCVLGYANGDIPDAKERKSNYVYYIR